MSYSVKIEPSGHAFQAEENETLLDAALRQGVSLPYGCRNGACGSCVAKVVSGEIKYPGDNHPPAVTEDEHTLGMTALCQACATSDVVIESREVDMEKDIQVKLLPCRIDTMERLNHDVMLLKLKLPSTERLQFLAGQYIEILLKDGRRRSFSIANDGDLFVCGTPNGRYFKGTVEFMRISLGTLKDAKTDIEELYAWQFDGPFLRDFTGSKPKGKRDAGALELID